MKWYHKLFFGRDVKICENIVSDLSLRLTKIHAGDYSTEPLLLKNLIPVDQYIETLESHIAVINTCIQTIESFNFFQTLKEGLKGGS